MPDATDGDGLAESCWRWIGCGRSRWSRPNHRSVRGGGLQGVGICLADPSHGGWLPVTPDCRLHRLLRRAEHGRRRGRRLRAPLLVLVAGADAVPSQVHSGYLLGQASSERGELLRLPPVREGEVDERVPSTVVGGRRSGGQFAGLRVAAAWVMAAMRAAVAGGSGGSP
jgi:hypothetical protein